jgi:3',5'-cyclic AMP phosphodiesterase CpdA
MPLGQHPLPRHVVAHVSDPHFLAERRLYDAIDTQENLRRAMAKLARLEMPPHAIVFTGDLADRGEAKATTSGSTTRASCSVRRPPRTCPRTGCTT